MMDWIGSAIEGVTGIFTKNTELKQVKAEGKLRIEKAKIDGEVARLQTALTQAGDYDVEAQRQMQHSWKDEILMIIFMAPFVAGFIPNEEVQGAIALGWETLGTAPGWYEWVVIGIVASTYGLRWLFKVKNPLK